MKERKLAIGLSLVTAGIASAGARIDLRPTPAVPPEGYQPNTLVNIDVYYVDTGNPELGNIGFRRLFLDAADSSATLRGPDGLWNTNDDPIWHIWVNPFAIGIVEPSLPNTSWLYPLSTPNPLFQNTLPNDGEVLAAHFYVQLDSESVTLDLMNGDNPDPNFGANAHFGFGGPGDPVTIWRAFTGELTGGVLVLPVAPGVPPIIIDSSPPHEAIDARQNLCGDFLPCGWMSVELIFDGFVSNVSVDDVELRQGGGMAPPVVVDAHQITNDRVHLIFNRPITPGTWTTIHHIPSDSSIRLGFLPGDVNADGRTAPVDILALIDAMNGVASRPLWSTDINRSGLMEPADILREIDLLNGAGPFMEWNGQKLYE